jgi:hypothetical protein
MQLCLKVSLFAFTSVVSFFLPHWVFYFLSFRSIKNSMPFKDVDSDKHSVFPVSILQITRCSLNITWLPPNFLPLLLKKDRISFEWNINFNHFWLQMRRPSNCILNPDFRFPVVFIPCWNSPWGLQLPRRAVWIILEIHKPTFTYFIKVFLWGGVCLAQNW